jgi:hypothetical protein
MYWEGKYMMSMPLKITFFVLAFFFTVGCKVTQVSKADSRPPSPPIISPKKALAEIDLKTIKHIAPEGRAQDGSLEDEKFNRLSIADDLIAHGKDSIPFLIGKLEDETEMERQTHDYWYKVYVGDVALIILGDLFTKNDGLTSTMPGFGWDEFLERGEKHRRKTIRARWQKMWDENRENIVWDDAERCFKLQNSISNGPSLTAGKT